MTPTPDVDCLVIGAGFGGIYAVHKLREAGFGVRAFEAGSDVGGVWFWNRYPGARCDVPSLAYQYSFSEELDRDWTWSERFATQPEIQRYARFVAERLDVLPHITFDTRVTAAAWDEELTGWRVVTDTGTTVTCRFLISAAGALSAAQTPPFAGIEDFAGQALHTSRWPADGVDLTGKRVAVIGTGSTGIQAVPEIAEQAEHVTVFQRTANFSVPAQNRPLPPDEVARAKAHWADRRAATFTTRAGHVIPTTGKRILDVSPEERMADLEKAWQFGGNEFLGTYIDTSKDLEANALLADFVRDKIRSIVHDPATAEKLVPTGHPIGSKRICVDTAYYETFNRPDVELVDLRAETIETFTPTGLRTTAAEYAFDTVVLATGFDALTGALTRIDIRGTDGQSLADEWAPGAQTYLGLTVPGFPNLFTVTGPGSPSVLVTVVIAIEHHVDWISGHLVHLRAHGWTRTEAEPAARDWWTDQVRATTQLTLHRHAPSSWYLGTNIPGKPRLFLPYAGGLDNYRVVADGIATDGYRGFAMTGAREQAPL
ncbi:flavin-containing monooxygenase [Trujillonella endophytica]|uniref:Cyclohexanone monooxygenase n=1 Tax=Trujillonella endophytica TaxID=673521 RepID=A0A1H8VWH8_9ACTN|nr:NAD(P)/FAD-dependent oxidoreductase [Trujillella endophytica]SEP19643.1 cyclohexanone monooxygenase [Trujillella endophytica]